MRRFAAAGNVGIVRRPVKGKNLPDGVAFSRVLLYPLDCLVKPFFRINVYYSHIHIAVCYRIIIPVRNEVHGFGITSVAAFILMVAENLNDIGIGKILGKQRKYSAPQLVVTAVIHKVARLYGEIIIDSAVCYGIAVGVNSVGVIFLSVAYNEEICRPVFL